MDIRNNKNIVSYGFLLFLIVAGLYSILGDNPNVENNINSLAIPVFLFSVAILLSKANKSIRESVNEKKGNLDRDINRLQRSGNSVETYDASRAYTIDELKKLRNQVRETNKTYNEYGLLCKKIIAVDLFTRVINWFAVLSFSVCLLSLIGVIQFSANCGYINTFSLALVFFDFFILDDIVQKAVRKALEKIEEEAEKKSVQDSVNGGDENEV